MKHLGSIILVIALFFSFTFTSCQKEEYSKVNTGIEKEKKNAGDVNIIPVDNPDLTDTAVIELLTNVPIGECLYFITDEKGNSFCIWGSEEDVADYLNQNPSVIAFKWIRCKDEASANELRDALMLVIKQEFGLFGECFGGYR